MGMTGWQPNSKMGSNATTYLTQSISPPHLSSGPKACTTKQKFHQNQFTNAKIVDTFTLLLFLDNEWYDIVFYSLQKEALCVTCTNNTPQNSPLAPSPQFKTRRGAIRRDYSSNKYSSHRIYCLLHSRYTSWLALIWFPVEPRLVPSTYQVKILTCNKGRDWSAGLRLPWSALSRQWTRIRAFFFPGRVVGDGVQEREKIIKFHFIRRINN